MQSLGRSKARLVAALKDHLAGKPLRIAEPDRLIWDIFARLCATRTYHAAGPNPISYAEIEAFCRIERLPLAPHHAALVRALDEAWVAHALARIGNVSTTVDRSPAVSQPINPAAFDAVFG